MKFELDVIAENEYELKRVIQVYETMLPKLVEDVKIYKQFASPSKAKLSFYTRNEEDIRHIGYVNGYIDGIQSTLRDEG